MIVDLYNQCYLILLYSLTMSDNLYPPTLNLLCDELREVVEWDQLAMYLNVLWYVIEDIRQQFQGISQRKMHILQKWLDERNTVHSWHTVADAVEKVNPAVAEHIRQKYASILDKELTRNNDSQLIPSMQETFHQCLKIVQKVRTHKKIVAIMIAIIIVYLLFHNFMPGNSNDREQILQRMKYPITHGKKETPIFIASQNGHFSVVSYLLHNGADPNIANEYGWTPLMTASANGHDDVIMILLEWKVPINTQNKNGETAIFIASQNNHSSVISTLLKNGADPNLANKYGWTPLMTASANGHSYIIKILLKWRILINTQNKRGETAIFIASQKGHSSIVSTLLNNGADPNLADKHGWTPLMAARSNGHHDVIQILDKSKHQE